MKVLVKVTKQILRRTRMCKPDNAAMNCAIAKAIAEILPYSATGKHVIHAFTDARHMWGWYNGLDVRVPIRIALPEEATQFITRFDAASANGRVNMPEVSFEIDIPNELIESIGIGQIYKVLSESKTLEMVMVPELV